MNHEHALAATAVLTGQSSEALKPDPLEYVSASRLSTWLRCRRQFYFRYVLGLTEAPSINLFIGKLVHATLQAWNLARWRNQEASVTRMNLVFEGLWAKAVPELDSARDDPGAEGEEKAKAWATLEKYIRSRESSGEAAPEAIEVQAEAVLPNGLSLVGILDLVRKDGVLVEYKTTSRRPDYLAPHQHGVQLTAYSILYRDATGSKEQGIELHYLVKTKTPSVAITPLPSMRPDQEEQFYELVDDYIEGIGAQRWLPSAGQHCAWCDFRERCITWKGGGKS